MKKLALSVVLAASFAFGVDYMSLYEQCVQGIGTACNRLKILCFDKKDGNACFVAGATIEAILRQRKMSTENQVNGYLLALDLYQMGCEYGSQKACNVLQKIRKYKR